MRYPSSAPPSVIYRFGPGPVTLVVKAPDLGERPAVRADVARARPRAVAGASARRGVHQALRLAAGHVHVPARRHPSHPVQHAGAVDVRRRAGAAVGLAVLPEVLPDHRDRRRRDHAGARDRSRGSVGAAMWTPTRSVRPGRSTGCCWPTPCTSRTGPSYLWSLFPVPAKYFVMIMGAIAFMLVGRRRPRRRREQRPSRRARRRVSVPSGVAGQPAGRDQVSLRQVQDESPAPQVRRAHRRPQRLGQAGALSTAERLAIVRCGDRANWRAGRIPAGTNGPMNSPTTVSGIEGTSRPATCF